MKQRLVKKTYVQKRKRVVTTPMRQTYNTYQAAGERILSVPSQLVTSIQYQHANCFKVIQRVRAKYSPSNSFTVNVFVVVFWFDVVVAVTRLELVSYSILFYYLIFFHFIFFSVFYIIFECVVCVLCVCLCAPI